MTIYVTVVISSATYTTPAPPMRQLLHLCDARDAYTAHAAPMRTCNIYATRAASIRHLWHLCDTHAVCGSFATAVVLMIYLDDTSGSSATAAAATLPLRKLFPKSCNRKVEAVILCKSIMSGRQPLRPPLSPRES